MLLWHAGKIGMCSATVLRERLHSNNGRVPEYCLVQAGTSRVPPVYQLLAVS